MGLITRTFEAPDGVMLAYHELGTGRPVVLLHGYMSTGPEIWMRTGIATRLADADRPRDALTSDAEGLIAHLELGDYDLGGYSLGGRIVARMVALGAKPGRAVVGGPASSRSSTPPAAARATGASFPASGRSCRGRRRRRSRST